MNKPLVNKKNILFLFKKIFLYCSIITPIIFLCMLYLLWGDLEFNYETLFKIIIFAVLSFPATIVLAGFVILWCLGVFFWFRLAKNYLALYFHASSNYRIFTIKQFLPFYGMRAEDLTDKGLYHRQLAIDGFFGFLLCMAFFGVTALLYQGVIIWSS